MTWRDVQHLIVYTSSPEPLSENAGWQTNGAGLRYNSRFGFGIMDAGAMVAAAEEWVNVPEMVSETVVMDAL